MTREELFNSKELAATEKLAIREAAFTSTRVFIPLTRDGIEAMLQAAAAMYSLPVDDGLRSTFCGYIHHLSNTTNEITIGEVADMLYKTLANDITWKIDQEIKAKRQAELLALATSPPPPASTEAIDVKPQGDPS